MSQDTPAIDILLEAFRRELDHARFTGLDPVGCLREVLVVKQIAHVFLDREIASESLKMELEKKVEDSESEKEEMETERDDAEAKVENLQRALVEILQSPSLRDFDADGFLSKHVEDGTVREEILLDLQDAIARKAAP